MIFLTKEELDRTEWLVDVDDKLKDYDRYWTELKQKVNKQGNAVSKVEIAFFIVGGNRLKKKLHQYEVMCIGLLFAVFGIVAWRVHAGGVTVMDTYVRGLVRGLQTESSLTFFSYFTKLGSAIGIVATLVISLLVFEEALLCCDDCISNGNFSNTSCE